MLRKTTILTVLFAFSTVSAADKSAGKTPMFEKVGSRKPASALKIKQSGVPQYEIFKAPKNSKTKIVEIPKLDVGQEPELRPQDLGNYTPLPQKTLNLPNLKADTPTPLVDLKKRGDLMKVRPVTAVKSEPATQAKKAPDVAALKEFADPKINTEEHEPRKFQNFTDSELKFFQALIFEEFHKNDELALGLYNEALANKSMTAEVSYRLAATARRLGLTSEYRNRMLALLESPQKDWSERAFLHLIQNISEWDQEVITRIDPYFDKYETKDATISKFHLIQAQDAVERKDLGKALEAIDLIPDHAKEYADAMYLRGLISYMSNKVGEALAAQKMLLEYLEKKGRKDDLYSLTALTLARLQFQKGEYKEAYQTYLKVGKDHPLWLQALTEQAWSQILVQDFEGAAGNMFSLHTDYFKHIYKPDSYIVRTIGYLNLCQYGDALQALRALRGTYTPVQAGIKKYKTTHKKDLEYFDTIKLWSKNPKMRTVEELPTTFVFELARHPLFVKSQLKINAIEEQTEKVPVIFKNLVTQERDALKELEQHRVRLAQLKKESGSERSPASLKKLTEEKTSVENKIIQTQMKHEIAKRSRTSLKVLTSSVLKDLDKEKAGNLKVAAKTLKTRFDELEKELDGIIDQVDVLAYEIFSGAGEHLRYQMAGGQVTKKERPKLTAEQEKQLNWKFTGEIWVDELGHYRSSLKNVCPQDESQI